MVDEHFGINIVEFMVRVLLAASLCKYLTAENLSPAIYRRRDSFQ